VLAALMILFMLMTSNDVSVRTLSFPTWKAIQRLSYFMFPLILVHALLYRINSKHLTGFYAIYLPVFLIVLLFQLTGVSLKQKYR